MAGELRQCTRCGYQTKDALRLCPKCGAALLSASSIKRLGWVLVVIGTFLAVAMCVVAWQTAPTMLQPGKTIDGTRFTGSAEMGRMALMLFGAVGLFGVLGIAEGVYQIRTGQRNKWLLMGLFGVLAVVLGLVFWIMRMT